MTYQDIIKDIKNKIYHPVYFLQGEEPYFIDKISDFIERNVLSEGEKSFNQTVLYGKDVDHMVMLDNLRRYPMMSNYQVVILKEAQDFKGLEKLEKYFENPLKSTIFVVAHKYKSIRKGTKFQKLVEKNSVFFDSKKLWDNQVPGFVEDLAKQNKQRIEPPAVQLLVEYLGDDLSKIEMELTKLEINVKDRAITTADIEQFIGISKEYNIFELTRALATRNTQKAFRTIDYFINNPKDNPPVVVMGFLYTFYSKAYSYYQVKSKNDFELMSALKTYKNMVTDLRAFGNNYTAQQTEAALDILQEYDLKFKGVNSTGSAKEELLKEMVWRLMN